MEPLRHANREGSVCLGEQHPDRGADFMGLIPEDGDMRSELHGFVVSLDGEVIVPRLKPDVPPRESSQRTTTNRSTT